MTCFHLQSEAILQLFRIHWFLQLLSKECPQGKVFFLPFYFTSMGVVAFGFFVSPPYLFIAALRHTLASLSGFTDWD